MDRKAIVVPDVSGVGPYSLGIEFGNLVFLSGQTPLNPATGKLAEGTIGDQTRQCLINLQTVLHAAGLSFGDVLKCTVFLTDMKNFSAMNEVYAEYFKEPFPARSTIGVASLPLGAEVEIELIAAKRS